MGYKKKRYTFIEKSQDHLGYQCVKCRRSDGMPVEIGMPTFRRLQKEGRIDYVPGE